jgi:cytochrome bd ubiquinol oxidase subunit II
VRALLSAIGLPEILAGLIVLALNAYVLTGGADYGGGLWDLLASGPRSDEQRSLIADSIAPIWEANHVWLIVVVVMLFTGFPAAFGTLGIVLHIPISLLLIGIVLRGSAFVFRSYGSHHRSRRERWGTAFAIASTAAPVLLGAIIGALASGEVGRAAARVGAASFTDVFVWPWLAAFPIVVGCFALALFAFLAAVYLALAAANDELRNDFRRRALIMAVIVFILAGLALLLSFSAAPRLARAIVRTPWAVLLHVCAAASAVTAIVAIWRRRYRVARAAAAVQVSCILWGWAFAQFPFIIPPTLTIRGAAASRATLDLLAFGLAGGALVLVPSLRYLFKTFARAAE